ncbi:hypothetical protein N9F74_00780 [Flavobacteriaceae bacterium]|nr:hypothetical protein [Flavobacteriaceae bacterium]
MNPKFLTLAIFILILLLSYPNVATAQNPEITLLYTEAMKAYEAGNYKKASANFKTIIEKNDFEQLSTTKLYNGACVFSLQQEQEQALQLLNYIAEHRFYSNLDHISRDTDLKNLYSNAEWDKLLEKVSENKKTQPERLRGEIKTALFQAKTLLLADDGKLWGKNLWRESILILDDDNTIYSLKPLPESKTNDSIIYYKKVPNNILSFSNSAQKYNNEEYAVVLSNYLDGTSATIIHELFHVAQQKHLLLNGDPITYLDNYDAREWLRLEFQALRNALMAIQSNKNKDEIENYVVDALSFRKERQKKYKKQLQKEIEIETSEGLANYTGFILSTNVEKYKLALAEIDQRAQASTYTRAFPYATGPAYGLIFDFLKINWKMGLDTTYDFLKIYEGNYLKTAIRLNRKNCAIAQKRNNYVEILQQEQNRKNEHEKIINYYKQLFIKKPKVSVKLANDQYRRTFDMNGTLILKCKGLVYSKIEGADVNTLNFGDFSTLAGKEKLGVSGVLLSFDGTEFTFPQALKIEKNTIIGEHYRIELNEGWEVIKRNAKGDMEIVKKKNKSD